MTIFVMDYSAGEVIRISPQSETRQEISTKYGGNVEDWLDDHPDQLGIRMKDSYWMETEIEEVNEIII